MAIKEKITVPMETVNDEIVVVVTQNFKTGDLVEEGEALCEIETSKAVVEIVTPAPGYIEWLCEKEQEVKVGSCLALIHDQMPDNPTETNRDNIQSAFKEKSVVDEKPLSETKVSTFSGKMDHATQTVFSHKALLLMKKNQVSEKNFLGKDIVREMDVKTYLSDTQHIKTTLGESQEKDSERIPTNVRLIKIPVSKKTEIRNLSNRQNLLTSNFSVKVHLPGAFFENESDSYFNNFKNNITPFLLIEQCKLLKTFPELNAFYVNDNIYFHNEVQLGYVLDLGKGLKVVNLGDLSNKTCNEVKKILLGYLVKYTKDKLSVMDLSGGTFTVTDVSAEEVWSFIPLINRFQSAILGISSIDVHDKCFLLNLVFDHRVTEGKKAAQVLKALKKATENFITKSLTT